jgi:hypothetical protein
MPEHLKIYEWSIWGALDVLFEIDDKGRVWSHAWSEDFNRFDGEYAGVLAEAITDMTSDENFSAAVNSFGYIAREWGVLAEVTILSMSHIIEEWGHYRYEYVLNITSVLSISASPYYTWRSNDGDNITGVSYTSGEHLEQGGRYLMLLDLSEDGPYINLGLTAIINDDGTITAVPDEYSAFEEYNGFTVGQMKEEAERAKAWHEAHVNKK